MYEIFAKIAAECWMVLGDMAPYLLLGFLMAGVLSVWIPPEWIERHLGGRGYGPVVKATLLGIPLPLCSCGVVPVAASIRRHGASRAATTSFLLSTPQTGVDSIAVTYALLGGLFAIFRPITALLTGLVGGGLVRLFGEPDAGATADNPPSACREPCCTDRHTHSFFSRALRYGFVTLPRDIGIALLLGVVIAGTISALTPADALRPYVGGGIVSILVMMAVGIPVYVCASASVPIAAAFIYMGVSPGAALAFLISGPATNAAMITTLWKLLGRRTAVLYLLTIVISGVGCGLALDWLFAATHLAVPHLGGGHVHEMGLGWFSELSAVLLLAVLAYSYGSAWRQKGVDQPAEGDGTSRDAPTSGRVELNITGMTCGHCSASVARALSACARVDLAEVDLKSGRAIVSGHDLDERELVGAVAELGYVADVAEPAA